MSMFWKYRVAKAEAEGERVRQISVDYRETHQDQTAYKLRPFVGYYEGRPRQTDLHELTMKERFGFRLTRGFNMLGWE